MLGPLLCACVSARVGLSRFYAPLTVGRRPRGARRLNHCGPTMPLRLCDSELARWKEERQPPSCVYDRVYVTPVFWWQRVNKCNRTAVGGKQMKQSLAF